MHGMGYRAERAETTGRCRRLRSSFLADRNASSTTSLRSAVHRSGTASSNLVPSSGESGANSPSRPPFTASKPPPARSANHLNPDHTAQRRSMWPRTLGPIRVKGSRVLRHRRRGSSSTMPALMETRASPPPGSRFGRMIPQLARRSTSVRSSRDTNTPAANSMRQADLLILKRHRLGRGHRWQFVHDRTEPGVGFDLEAAVPGCRDEIFDRVIAGAAQVAVIGAVIILLIWGFIAGRRRPS